MEFSWKTRELLLEDFLSLTHKESFVKLQSTICQLDGKLIFFYSCSIDINWRKLYVEPLRPILFASEKLLIIATEPVETVI